MNTIIAGQYSLALANDRPYVYLNDQNGKLLAELFVYSSVHPLHTRDDSTDTGNWVVEELPGLVTASLTTHSSIWQEKIYRFNCYPDHLTYEIEVEGEGQLWEVEYFGGYFSGQPRWGTGFFWSGQSFIEGFTPEPNTKEAYYFRPSENSTVDLLGVPLPGKGSWFFTPPPFCFAFKGRASWMGLGVEAQACENRFTEYHYHGKKDAFYLSLSYEGYTTVSGRFQLPALGFVFAEDEYETIQIHVGRQSGGSRVGAGSRSNLLANKPSWWFEPIFCGWGSQCYLASQVKGTAPNYSRQKFYECFLETLAAQQVSPGIIVLDDKWQSTYGDNQVDPAKWPDLPGFIRNRHAEGRKVLLWIKAWDPEGIPVEECITNAAGLPVAVDPTNSQFEARLRSSVRQMLSSEGYDADGLKIDFTARIPSGPGMRLAGDLWGLELMRRYLEIIYTEAKFTKADALVMTHTPHPYLAGVLDMIRLNDINRGADVNRAMIRRARMASIACPDAIIDTDNWPIPNKAAWRKYLQLQPDLGVPSLYYASHIDTTGEALTGRDYELIRRAWERYRARNTGKAKTHSRRRSQAIGGGKSAPTWSLKLFQTLWRKSRRGSLKKLPMSIESG